MEMHLTQAELTKSRKWIECQQLDIKGCEEDEYAESEATESCAQVEKQCGGAAENGLGAAG